MSEEMLQRLGRIADVMIPPETGFPAAARLVTRFAVHSASLDDVFLALTGPRPTARPTDIEEPQHV